MLHCTSWTERLTKQCIRGIVLRRAEQYEANLQQETLVVIGVVIRATPPNTLCATPLPSKLKAVMAVSRNSLFIPMHVTASQCQVVQLPSFIA